jgi:hypothetical protein
LLILAAVALLAGALSSPAAAAPGLEVALQDDFVFVQQSWYGREAALANARQLGVTRLRVNVPWARTVSGADSRTAPSERTYAWAAYDGLIADAARYGIRVQMTLAGPAPAWATGNHRIGPRQVKAAAFAQFATDTAAYFRGRIDRYSIWNEPNWHTALEPAATCRKRAWARGCDAKLGRLYRSLYSSGYKAITSADPSAQVLFGELAPQRQDAFATAPLTLLRAVTCSKRNWRAARRCGTLRAHGFAQHPYAFTVKPTSRRGLGPDDVTLSSLNRLTGALDKLARRRALVTPSGRKMELYLTEHGYFQAGKRKLSQAKRAAYLRQSFDLALRNRRVRQLLQYLLVTPAGAADTFPTQIMSADGRPTPAFTSLADWANRNLTRIAGPTP